jgi:asparagine synthase (glutamine-hydrolysing)
MEKIPANIKFSGGRMKHIFKEAARNIIPKPIIERKDKMGFNTPLNQWINGSAKDFVYDLLTSQRAHERGLYNMKNLISYIENPNSHTRATWGILCLELWHTVFIDQNNA